MNGELRPSFSLIKGPTTYCKWGVLVFRNYYGTWRICDAPFPRKSFKTLWGAMSTFCSSWPR